MTLAATPILWTLRRPVLGESVFWTRRRDQDNTGSSGQLVLLDALCDHCQAEAAGVPQGSITSTAVSCLLQMNRGRPAYGQWAVITHPDRRIAATHSTSRLNHNVRSFGS